MIADHEARNILAAWGQHALDEIESEVGYPSVSASCRGYTSPDWTRTPPGPIRPGDIERACWAMVVMSARHARYHRDLRDHYRDGVRMDGRRLEEGRARFRRIWAEWEVVRDVANPL